MKILRKVGAVKKADATIKEKKFGQHAVLRIVNGKPGIIFEKLYIISGGTATVMQAREGVATMKAAIRDIEAAIAEAEKAN